MPDNKINVIFVCLGNICRSPLAEAIFNAKINEYKLRLKIACSSAGTAHWHVGDKPDPRTLEIAADHGIPVNHLGKQLNSEDYKEFDYIIAMDRENLRTILANLPVIKQLPTILMMREFDKDHSGADVPDPYYGDMEDFEMVYQILDESCNNFIRHLFPSQNF